MCDQLSVTALETIAARGWRGTSTLRIGDWLLRAGSGFTGRANSVLPLGSAGCPLDAALDQVADFYAEQGLPPKIQMPLDEPGSPLSELDRELQDRGWRRSDDAIVMIASLAALLEACPPDPTLPAASLEPVPSIGWLAGYQYRGRPLPPAAVAVLVNADSPVFASVSPADGGDIAGVGRGVIDDGWLGVTAVTVGERHRRTGVGRQVMGELGRWAADRAAHSVYLQVDSLNEVAVAMYGRLGFTQHHRYRYLSSPEA